MRRNDESDMLMKLQRAVGQGYPVERALPFHELERAGLELLSEGERGEPRLHGHHVLAQAGEGGGVRVVEEEEGERARVGGGIVRLGGSAHHGSRHLAPRRGEGAVVEVDPRDRGDGEPLVGDGRGELTDTVKQDGQWYHRFLISLVCRRNAHFS